jgi:hypothetical protein
LKPFFHEYKQFVSCISPQVTLLRKKYEATVGPDFYFQDSRGNRYRPAKDKFLHNMGNIPWIFQWIPALQKDRFPVSYACHDIAWDTLHVNKWIHLTNTYTLVKCSRAESNRLLKEMVQAERGVILTSYVIRTGVGLGAMYEDVKEIFGGRRDFQPCPS